MKCSKKYLEAVRFSARLHALANYNGEPYYVHFEDVEQVLIDHKEDDEESLIEANLHDCLEDSGISYNDIKKKFGIAVAEVVYLCTDNKGRNRAERKNKAFYDEIKGSLQAIKIKVADRLANARSSVKNGHGMSDMYKKEYAHFKSELYFVGHIDSMWKELDELMKVSELSIKN